MGDFAAGSARRRWLLLFALLVYACAFQGARPLYSPDEGRYTNVALAMLDDGDWLRPMLHHEVEHWSKPPLTYWAIATSVAVFGRHEFAARLPFALAFALTTLLLVPLGRRFTPAQPWLPALVYATFLFPPSAANLVTTDTLLTLWEALQAFAFASLWWAATPRAQTRARLLLWLAAALAFMTKGPPGLLILAASAAFAASCAGWRGLLRIFRWDGLLVFVIVGGAWYADVAIREPGVIRYFLVEEVVNRVASDKMHRNAEWYGAFKVYLPVLVLGTLPWFVPAAHALWKRRAGLWRRIRSNDESRLLLCWVVLPLAVFALSRSRLPLYVLPLFVPFALVAARAIEPLDLAPAWRRMAIAAWCVLLVLARIVPAYMDVAADDKRLAEELRAQLTALPGEIAFIETAPRYGLRFYLGSEIERLYLPDSTPTRQSEEFGREMREQEGCRVLLAEPQDLQRIERELRRDAVPYRRLADTRGYVVIAQLSHDCPAYAMQPDGVLPGEPPRG